MYPCSVPALRVDALSAPALQRSDEVNADQIHQAIAVSLGRRGGPRPAAANESGTSC